MTTPTATPEQVLAEAAPEDVAGAHRLIDHLEHAGLPTPRRRTIRADHGEPSLSVTLHSEDDLGTWAGLLDTIDTIDTVAPGPWHIGPAAYRVRVGRLAGLSTVLAAQIPPGSPDAARPGLVVSGGPSVTADQPRDPATTSAATPGPLDDLTVEGLAAGGAPVRGGL